MFNFCSILLSKFWAQPLRRVNIMSAKSAVLRAVPNEKQLELARQKVNLLDLSAVKRRLGMSKGWNSGVCDNVELQYKAFLLLHLEPHGHALVPTKKIDEMWHEHILHTRSYVDFCNDVFGEYMHHNPDTIDSRGLDAHHENFHLTVMLLQCIVKLDDEDKSIAACAWCDVSDCGY